MTEPSDSLKKQSGFRLLLGGATVSAFGRQITLLAIPLAAVTLMNASVIAVALLTATGSVANLLFGLPSGVIADRVHRQRELLLLCEGCRAAAIASIPLAALMNRLTLVQFFVVALIDGAVSTLFVSVYYSYLPRVVTSKASAEAVARLTAGQSVSRFAGPVLAGVMVQILGAATFLVDAAGLLLSGCAIGLARVANLTPRLKPSAEGAWSQAMEGLKFTTKHPTLRALVSATATGNAVSMMYSALVVSFLARVVGLRAGLVGVLLAIGALGGVFGSFMSLRLTRRYGVGVTLRGASALMVAGMLLLASTFSGFGIVLFGVGAFATSFGIGVFRVQSMSLRQELCPEEMLGRVYSSMRFLSWGLMPLGAVAGGVIATAIGLRPALYVAALFQVIPWLLISRRDFREVLETGQSDIGSTSS